MLINYIFGLIFLILQSINDIKTYEIDEKLCYVFGIFGIIYHIILFLIFKNLNYLLFPIFVFSITFCILYILWKIGLIGGGDLKVLATISLITPVFKYNHLNVTNILPLYLFVFSILCTLPFAILFTLSKRNLKFWLNKIFELKKELKFFCCLLILLYIEYLFNINNIILRILLLMILFKLIPENKIILTSFLIIDLIINPKATLITTAIVSSIILIIIYLKTFRQVLSKKVSIDSAKGEILSYDYFIVNGKLVKTDPFKRFLINDGKPVVLSKASGLTDDEIKTLKKYGIKEIEVKEKIPFVPSILIGYLILYFFWKIWYI